MSTNHFLTLYFLLGLAHNFTKVPCTSCTASGDAAAAAPPPTETLRRTCPTGKHCPLFRLHPGSPRSWPPLAPTIHKGTAIATLAREVAPSMLTAATLATLRASSQSKRHSM